MDPWPNIIAIRLGPKARHIIVRARCCISTRVFQAVNDVSRTSLQPIRPRTQGGACRAILGNDEFKCGDEFGIRGPHPVVDGTNEISDLVGVAARMNSCGSDRQLIQSALESKGLILWR